jgi:hypothetical protein
MATFPCKQVAGRAEILSGIFESQVVVTAGLQKMVPIFRVARASKKMHSFLNFDENSNAFVVPLTLLCSHEDPSPPAESTG